MGKFTGRKTETKVFSLRQHVFLVSLDNVLDKLKPSQSFVSWHSFRS